MSYKLVSIAITSEEFDRLYEQREEKAEEPQPEYNPYAQYEHDYTYQPTPQAEPQSHATSHRLPRSLNEIAICLIAFVAVAIALSLLVTSLLPH